MTAPTDVPMPRRIAGLPRDGTGRPVPWCAPVTDGRPAYRVVAAAKVEHAIRHRLCWVCGWTLGPKVAFLFAGGLILSRQSTEPPAHEACAVYTARACPFLVDPPRPEGAGPAVTAVWVTRHVEAFPTETGVLLRAGDATHVTWWAAGEPADRETALAALDAAHATLRALTDAPGTIQHLGRRYDEAVRHLPPEVAP